MRNAPDPNMLEKLAAQLSIESPVPTRHDAEQRLISCSYMFRDKEKALQFSRDIKLSRFESLAGGYTEDSIGRLWWLGVKISNSDHWRSGGGFHRFARQDPEIPGNKML